ncbi:LAMI_0H17590g1_1 [Lachancea mirantina]|uniref:Exocyst complex component SEC5 n=1 Tax=Lachancea mirantina TaxID=1230905 RepID=A0A1G4KJF6_9SACH|nr:LAMI_0H17590g1_1 [Lachancea mirantina]
MKHDPFGLSDVSVLKFYNLKDADPSTSWKEASILKRDLPTREKDGSLSSSYAILSELLSQENAFEANATNKIETKDLRDPLESQNRLVTLLDNRQIAESERNKYYINDKKFHSKLFLKNLHSDDSFEALSSSLDHLDRSLKDQSDQLRELVQFNFAKYVRCKSNLDRIYEQFSKWSDGTEGEKGLEVLHVSVDDGMRETMVRLKPLLDAGAKKEQLQAAITYVQENKSLFSLPKLLRRLLDQKDYANLLFEYNKALKIQNRFKGSRDGNPVTMRIWREVDKIMGEYKRVTWDKLLASDATQSPEKFLSLMSRLLDLKVSENPITSWINARLDVFDTSLSQLMSQLLPKIVAAQQRILRDGSEEDVDLTFYPKIKNLTTSSSNAEGIHTFQYAQMSELDLPDTPIVIEMWLLILKLINRLVDFTKSFSECWESIEKFLDGTYQASMVNDKHKDNILGTGTLIGAGHSDYFKLERAESSAVKIRGESIVKRLCDDLLKLFQSSQTSLRADKPAEKEVGEPKNFGFLPPRSNCLACMRYLPRIVEPILKFTTEIAQLKISPSCIDCLRNLDLIIIERSVGAISSTKQRDLSQFHAMDEWTLRKGDDEFFKSTQFPEMVLALQRLSIKTLRDILFSHEKFPILNGVCIISHPSRKLLTGIELQQIISMETVLESILKGAARNKDNPRTPETIMTLANLRYLREDVFPSVLRYFDDCFDWQLSKKNLELFTLLNKMESSILGNYLSDLKVRLRDILEREFNEIDWTEHSSSSFRVADYVIEVLMEIVIVHRETFRISPQIMNRTLEDSQIFISKYLFEAFKPYIGNISSDGMLQATVDLQFLQKVFGNMLQKDAQATILACLQNCFEEDTARMERCLKDTEPIVKANLIKTHLQFAPLKLETSK